MAKTSRELALERVIRVILLDAKLRLILDDIDPMLVLQAINALGSDPLNGG